MTAILNPDQAEAKFTKAGKRFTFSCHPEVSCFNACCRGLNMVLTPYDVLRLARRLDMTTGEFIDSHTLPTQEGKSRWPLIRLKMNDDAEQTCPFLTEQGCRVYEDRSSACRIYPLARATSQGYSKGEVVEQYFVVEEDHCRGFDQERIFTIPEWVSDQGLISYHRWNDRWMLTVTHPKGPGEGDQAEKNRQMFYLASYNLDRFREFVVNTKFLDIFEIDLIRRERLDHNDEELLALAMDWLAFSMCGDKTLKLKGGTR